MHPAVASISLLAVPNRHDPLPFVSVISNHWFKTDPASRSHEIVRMSDNKARISQTGLKARYPGTNNVQA
jgi:hypothetical protein